MRMNKPPCIWYVCKYCRRAYSVRADLARHKYREHPLFREERLLRQADKLLKSLQESDREGETTSTTGESLSGNEKAISETGSKSSAGEPHHHEVIDLDLEPDESPPHQENPVDELPNLELEPLATMPRFGSSDEESSFGTAASLVPEKLCAQCGKTFTSDYDLKYHELLEHSGDPKQILNLIDNINGQAASSPHHDPDNDDKSTTSSKTNKNCDNQNENASKNEGRTNLSKRSKKKRQLESRRAKAKAKSNASKCTVCGKRYRNSGHLKSHMKSHLSQKTYFCKYCHKTFQFKDEPTFLRHVTTCSKESEFRCTIPNCTLTFHFKADLQSHELMEHGINAELSCHLCSRFFNRKSALDTHIKLTHPTAAATASAEQA